VTVADCLAIYEPEMLRWIFASQRPGSEFQISFDLDVIKLYEDFDRARRLAHEAQDGSKADKKREIARRTFELSSLTAKRIESGSPVPFIPAFRGLSVVLQAYDGDIDRSLARYEILGKISTDEEKRIFRQRAECCWRWIEEYAPEHFRYRMRTEAVARALSPDQRRALERLVGVLRDQPNIAEVDLIPHMQGLCEGTDLTLKTFCPIAYDLLIGRDQGPKLTTLLTTISGDRAVPLLSLSLRSD
jgi:lysyl-tRNA synthetase class 1